MKRLIPALLALLVLIGSASAERTVVTALASEINPDNLVSVAFDAKINACDDGVFNITILVPERYDPEEIKASMRRSTPAMTVCSTSQSLCRNAMTRRKSRR